MDFDETLGVNLGVNGTRPLTGRRAVLHTGAGGLHTRFEDPTWTALSTARSTPAAAGARPTTAGSVNGSEVHALRTRALVEGSADWLLLSEVDTAVIGTIQDGSGGFTFGTTALLRGLRLRGVRAAPSWNDLVNAANARDAQAIAQRCVRNEEARIVPATKCRAR